MDNILKETIEKDIFRYFNRNKRPLLYNLRMPSIKYMIAFRKAQFHRKQHNKIRHLYYEFRLRMLTDKYLIQIPTNTKIGKGLYIGHVGSVIVNGDAILGNNVNLSVGITIGQTNRGFKKGSPVIGDNVWIGTNAVIVGKVNIGSNVLIAPNAYVNFDVPDNSIIVGNPGKITHNYEATVGYVHNTIEV